MATQHQHRNIAQQDLEDWGTYEFLLDWQLRRTKLVRDFSSEAQRAEGLFNVRLTKNLLQLHDGGIGTNAVNGLRLLEVHSLLEHLTVGAIGVVLVRHLCVVKVKLR